MCRINLLLRGEREREREKESQPPARERAAAGSLALTDYTTSFFFDLPSMHFSAFSLFSFSFSPGSRARRCLFGPQVAIAARFHLISAANLPPLICAFRLMYDWQGLDTKFHSWSNYARSLKLATTVARRQDITLVFILRLFCFFRGLLIMQ